MNEESSFSERFLDGYFQGLNRSLVSFLSDPSNRRKLFDAGTLLMKTRDRSKKAIIIGNGGSSAIAEHLAVDLTKGADLRAISISGSPLLTAISNDYGYEKVFAKGVERYGDAEDVLVAISSGGRSKNILFACDEAKKKKMSIITLSGFDSDNPLKRMGDVNIWVDSRAYGYLEIIHGTLLHFISDMIIGRIEYGQVRGDN